MSCMNYAARLSKNQNRGPVGKEEFFDNKEEEEKKWKELIKKIRQSKYVIIHAGAGISTSSGLQDFRGPTGIWTNELKREMKEYTKKKKKKAKSDVSSKQHKTLVKKEPRKHTTEKSKQTKTEEPIKEEITEHEKEKINYSEIKKTNETLEDTHEDTEIEEMLVKFGNRKKKVTELHLALPSKTHIMMKELVKKNIVKFCIIQNIDSLHYRCNIKFSNVAEIHGNIFVERCDFCGRRYLRDYIISTISFSPTGSMCFLCSIPPIGICTDVLLDWNDAYEDFFHSKSIKHSKEADFHFCLGSSFFIMPAGSYPSKKKYANKNSYSCLINYQQSSLTNEVNLHMYSNVNKISDRIIKEYDLDPLCIRKAQLIIVRCPFHLSKILYEDLITIHRNKQNHKEVKKENHLNENTTNDVSMDNHVCNEKSPTQIYLIKCSMIKNITAEKNNETHVILVKQIDQEKGFWIVKSNQTCLLELELWYDSLVPLLLMFDENSWNLHINAWQVDVAYTYGEDLSDTEIENMKKHSKEVIQRFHEKNKNNSNHIHDKIHTSIIENKNKETKSNTNIFSKILDNYVHVGFNPKHIQTNAKTKLIAIMNNEGESESVESFDPFPLSDHFKLLYNLFCVIQTSNAVKVRNTNTEMNQRKKGIHTYEQFMQNLHIPRDPNLYTNNFLKKMIPEKANIHPVQYSLRKRKYEKTKGNECDDDLVEEESDQSSFIFYNIYMDETKTREIYEAPINVPLIEYKKKKITVHDKTKVQLNDLRQNEQTNGNVCCYHNVYEQLMDENQEKQENQENQENQKKHMDLYFCPNILIHKEYELGELVNHVPKYIKPQRLYTPYRGIPRNKSFSNCLQKLRYETWQEKIVEINKSRERNILIDGILYKEISYFPFWCLNYVNDLLECL